MLQCHTPLESLKLDHRRFSIVRNEYKGTEGTSPQKNITSATSLFPLQIPFVPLLSYSKVSFPHAFLTMNTVDNTTSDSASPSAFSRPPKAPPLNSMPSTPGPEVPGGYPRNSVVFATNKWDHRSAKAPSQAKSEPSGMLANAATYLPPAVASYFPPQPSSSSATAEHRTTAHTLSPPGSTPYVYPLPTDSSAVSANSNFSTQAHAGTGSSRGTLTPTGTLAPSYAHLTDGHPPTPGSGLRSHFSDDSSLPPTPGVYGSDGGERPTSAVSTRPTSMVSTAATSVGARASTADANPPAHDLNQPRTQLTDRGVEPLPSVAPFAAASAFIPTRVVSPPSTDAVNPSSSPGNSSSSGSGSSGTRSALSTQISTTPSSDSPRSPSSPKAPHSPLGSMRHIGSSLSRFASRRGHRKGVSVDHNSPPPSAFGVRGRRASLDSGSPASPSVPSSNTHPPVSNVSAGSSASPTSPTSPTTRKPSLLRTLRGEAKVFSGRLRRDPARVEEGKRMAGGEA
ncbi:hypothetical protein C8R43DRAFT_1037664 [Mycena crocata]|nr:hypothetical protein C8R43DRAFT_1037664 [Mycena crocata]